LLLTTECKAEDQYDRGGDSNRSDGDGTATPRPRENRNLIKLTGLHARKRPDRDPSPIEVM
jgi:hypothetical protein